MSSRARRPPRVLQVVLSLNPGGTERLVVELATRLAPEMPMMVCCLDEEGLWAEKVRSRDIEVHALGRPPGFHPWLGVRLARVAALHGATLVHAHHYSPFVYSSLARLLRPRTRLIFTEHGRLSDARPSAKRRAANFVLAHVPDRIVAVSADLAAHMAAEGFPAPRVEVVHNGIDVGPPADGEARRRARERLAVASGVLVVGTVARLDPVKDLGTLVRAAALAAGGRPVLVLVIGDGPEAATLQALARDVGAPAVFRFLGHRDDAREWLLACDLYVNCSISEGVSLTILEAMAAGLPVVATAVGGTPEVVDDTCGCLIRPRAPDVLARAIADLADAPARRQALGTAARHRVESAFTLARMVSCYADLYRRLS